MNNNKKDNDNKSYIEIPDFINTKDSSGLSSPRKRVPLENTYDSDDFIKEINSSLAKQINADMENKKPPVPKASKKKRSRIYKAPLIMLVILLVLISAMMFTDTGKKMIINLAGNYIYDHLNFQASEGFESAEDQTEDGSNLIVQDHVVNILLLGLEENGGARNTDSMIVATMNTKNHTLKLSSLMRDLYVQIPGYKDNKLNSAYAKGDISLLYQTIEMNFGLDLNGYCLVNYDAFEQIVDLVGGVEITLTEEEAKYLNRTNYISEKSNRNVVAGTQIMNGNQALGYCRIRYVSTGTENNDFGRTQRQRVVLEAIYDKVKSKNVISLVVLMNKILTQADIETNITNKEFNRYLQEAVSLKVKELETMRIPSDGTYNNARVPIGSRNVEVLQPKDWNATREELHTFIYGEETATTEATE